MIINDATLEEISLLIAYRKLSNTQQQTVLDTVLNSVNVKNKEKASMSVGKTEKAHEKYKNNELKK